MSDQLSLFDVMAGDAIRVPVDPDGEVVQGPVDETLSLPEPRMAWNAADIELHRHTNSLWMWSTSFHINGHGGSGYRVGPKWGQFAETRDRALLHAIAELRADIEIRLRGLREDAAKPKARRILKWLDTLT